MKNMKTSTSIVRALSLALPAILLCASLQNAGAATYPPERMSYQGFLTDSSGSPLGNVGPKNYDVIFRIWADQFGTGNRMWAEQQTITVDKGYFSVLLGEGVSYSSEDRPLLSSVFAPSAISNDRFIDITVKGIGAGGTDATIAPRVRLLSSPYAFLAGAALNATNAVFASYANNLVNGLNSQVITIPTNGTAVGMSGNLNVSGSATIAKTLVVTGQTTLTGPLTASGITANGLVTATTGFSGYGTIPLGGIIMWSGAIGDIPSGWALCNGQTLSGRVTPNLTDRFVMGAGSSYTVGTQAGFASVTLNALQIPAHIHAYKDAYYAEKAAAANNVTGGGSDYLGQSITASGSYDHDNDWAYWRPMTTATNVTTGAAVPTLPPYYALAYIMRVL